MSNKELNLVLRTAIVAGLAASACGEARGSNQTVNTAEKPGVMTAVDPQVAAELTAMAASPTPTEQFWTPTATETLIPEPTATFEPTATPERFIEGQEVKGMILVDETSTIAMDFTPVSYTAENLDRFESFEGNLSLVTWDDKYHNEIYAIHDGQAAWRDLPAEALRQFIQEQGADEVEQMAKLIGARVVVSQDGRESWWDVAAVQKVKHEDVKSFLTDMWSVVDRLIEFTVRDGVANEFEVARVGGGKIFIFCGRTDDLTQADWYKYTRYALLLLPAE